MIACVTAVNAPPAHARGPTGPYESFRARTDNVPQAEISGWVLPAAGRAKGTVFVLHGWRGSKEAVVGWEWLRDREAWNVVMIDLREHGESTHTAGPSTLGYHEIWDVKAAVDHAERRDLRRPYVIYGVSLGASVGLRWASMDRRIEGVFAVSPFKNAYLATRQTTADVLGLDFLPSPFALHSGLRKMLEAVDLPHAVRNRDDLRIWILVGGRDCFPESDQLEILAASAPPAHFKRIVVAPQRDHRNVWNWPGDATTPSHDACLRQFMAVSSSRTSAAVPTMAAIAIGIGLMGVSALARRRRRRFLTNAAGGTSDR